jgi:hypothetical protein
LKHFAPWSTVLTDHNQLSQQQIEIRLISSITI